MAGVFNKRAKQFNLRGCGENSHRVTIRIAPGFNSVNDEHWAAFFDKKGKVTNAYLKQLQKNGDIAFGKEYDDMELERDPDTVSKSKSVPLPKKPKRDKDI